MNDAAYAVASGDRTVAYIALSAARTVTLPSASAYPAGAVLTVVDESGACSATVALTLAAAGSDRINGAASAVIAAPYGYLALESNTSNKWTVIDAPAPVASVAGRTGAVVLGVADVPGAAPLASPALTGVPTAPNAAAGTNSAQVATTSFVAASFVTYGYATANYAPLASPALTGTPTAPTMPAGDSSTKLATTGYADRAVGAAFSRSQVSDAAYAVPVTDRAVAFTALTAARAVTLPAASAYPQGQTLIVFDESGACSATNAIAVNRNGPSDTIDGAASAAISTPYGYLAFQSNGSNKWTVVNAPAPVASVAGRTGAVALAVADVSGAAPLASPALTGTPTAPNAPAGTNSAQVATTSFVAASFVTYAYAGATYATAASPTLTGTPTAPTAGTGNNSTQLATTAYADRAAAQSNRTRTQVVDSNYTVLAADRVVAVVSLTAARTINLPAVSNYPQGATLTVFDESGACSATNTLTVSAAGSDLINGSASAAITTAYGYLALASNASNKWTIVDAPGTGGGSGGGSNVTLASLGGAALDDLRQVMIQVARLTGSVLGLLAGAADDFRDQTGVDTSNSVNANYDNGTRTYNNANGVEASQSLPAMTSNTTPSGTASASSIYNSNYDAWYAFDQANGTLWSASSSSLPQWVQRQLPSAVTVVRYGVTSRSDISGYDPTGWTFLGSNDGTSWTQLDAQTGVTFGGRGVTNYYTVASPASFIYYRLNITAAQGTPSIGELILLKATTGGPLDLRSVAFQAQAAPSKGSVFFLVKVNAGTLTLNTNLTASVSRNGGTTWTPVTLAAAGTLSSGYAAYEANGQDVTAQSAGQSMKWRLQTAGSLSVGVQAAVLQWG